MRDDLIGLPHNPSPPDPDERLNRLAVYRYIQTIIGQLEDLGADLLNAELSEWEKVYEATCIMDEVLDSIERRDTKEFS
jgi:hypothetical protein